MLFFQDNDCSDHRNFKPVLFLLWVLLVTGSSLYAQPFISGNITGADGEALSGATITVKNNNNSTISDMAGRFSVKANPGSIIEFSFTGYNTRQTILGNETELNISLTEKIVNLEEVIAIGYGTARKKDVTGSVASIKANDFNKGIVTNPMQQLQGKVAGLLIVQPGGDPNGEFTVRLRGATSLEGQPPLLVIDGVAIDDFNKALTTLNPADIESYNVLKDASAAAIYGSRGANGIILVTTKKGRAGKVAVDYTGFAGIEKISRRLHVLNADEWRKATAGMNAGSLDAGGDTDWQKNISQTGFSHSHTIGISGGTGQFNFRGSVSYTRRKGVILNSGNEIITGRLNAVQKSLKNKLEMRYGINISTIKRDLLADQTSTSLSRTSGAQIFSTALQYLPVWPAYNPDGSYYQPSSNMIKPLFVLKEVYSKQTENFFQGSVKADYELIKGLKIGTLLALSRGNDIYNRFLPTLQGSNVAAEASKSNYNLQNFSGDIHGNYYKRFNKHSIDLTGVYEYNKYVNDNFGLTARGFLLPQLLNNNLGAATNITTSDIFSNKNEVKLISFVGRFVYNYNGRYILSANFRRDGSSKFGIDKRWGNFPSVAFAWRAGNENFLKDVTWLNNLKLRISYGLTGNQENLLSNSYQVLYGPAGPYLYNGQFYQSYAVTQEYNPDLKWEVRKSLNMGIDFSVFDDRLYGTIDVYDDKTNDMLFQYDLPQPPFLTNVVTANAANAINKGVEVSMGAVIVTNKNFRWSANTNVATLKNSVTNLSGRFRDFDLSITNRHYGFAEGSGLSGAYISQLQVGYPAGVFWLPQHAGLDATGKELFNNYDADGKLTGSSNGFSDKDRVFIDPTPDFTWGISNDISYKHFDLGILIRGVQGQKIFANTLLNLEASVYLPVNNVLNNALTNGFANQPIPSDYWIRNASFARLENLTLGYNFKNPEGIKTLRLYVTGTNLFVITSYKGIDPEIKTEGPQRYIDRNYYPKTRGFLFGVNIGF